MHLGLGRDGLSEQGRRHLQAIAGVSQQLGLATTDKAAVLAVVVELCQQQWAAEDSQVCLSLRYSRLGERGGRSHSYLCKKCPQHLPSLKCN